MGSSTHEIDAMDSLYDDHSIDAFRRERRIDPVFLRRLRASLFRLHEPLDVALRNLPEQHRPAFVDRFGASSIRLEKRRDSSIDGATRFVFANAAGERFETVLLRIRSGRTSVCVSSQVGCAARCRFCATGQMGKAIDLHRGEILDQVAEAARIARDEGRRLRNVVFMGMGEPFHNEDEVFAAIETLTSSQGFGLSPRHVLVSTVGVPDAMARFAKRFPDVGLAVSLHAARQGVRESLIPLARRHPLGELRSAIASTARPVMIEYLMLDGVNDADADLAALIGYLAALPVHVNLIPYNPIEGAELKGTPSHRVREFRDAIAAAGYRVTVRRSLGQDIAAACGQLAINPSARRRREEGSRTVADRPSGS